MNWNTYKEATKKEIEGFGTKMRKLEMEHLIGKEDVALRETLRQEIRDHISEMFNLQEQLSSITEDPETMAAVVADILGLKGERRDRLMEASRSGLNKDIT